MIPETGGKVAKTVSELPLIAPGEGFEPSQTDPDSVVLPLHYPGMTETKVPDQFRLVKLLFPIVVNEGSDTSACQLFLGVQKWKSYNATNIRNRSPRLF